jgi:hypothetical protein
MRECKYEGAHDGSENWLRNLSNLNVIGGESLNSNYIVSKYLRDYFSSYKPH